MPSVFLCAILTYHGVALISTEAPLIPFKSEQECQTYCGLRAIELKSSCNNPRGCKQVKWACVK